MEKNTKKIGIRRKPLEHDNLKPHKTITIKKNTKTMVI
jgi:hypothetical protein